MPAIAFGKCRLPQPSFDYVIFDSIVIGIFVGIYLTAAHALQLQKAYWVPVSCLAVIQGVSLLAVWNKQLQRVIGGICLHNTRFRDVLGRLLRRIIPSRFMW